MRRNSLLIGGWVVATVLALVLGLQGVRAVSNSVTVHRPASLSPASVKAALQRADDASSSSSSSAESTSASDSSSAAGAQDDAGSSSSDRAPGPTIAPGPDDHGSAASDDSTASSLPPSSSSSDGGPAGEDGGDGDSHSGATAAPQDKTYQLQGGSVGVRFENGAAHLLWATPNSGYSVENRSDASTVEIRFRSSEHESRLKAYWDNGPREEIEEND